jgi:hypothetical protein
MKLFSNDYAEVSLDETVPCICIKTFDLPKNSTQLREAMNGLINACEKFGRHYQALGILSDTSHAAGAITEDLEWVARHVVPRLQEAGICRMAILDPQLAVARTSMEEYLELSSSDKMEQRVFGSIVEARKWLYSR